VNTGNADALFRATAPANKPEVALAFNVGEGARVPGGRLLSFATGFGYSDAR